MVVERLAENDASAKARYIEWFCVVLTPHCWAGFSQAGCFGGGASRLSKGVWSRLCAGWGRPPGSRHTTDCGAMECGSAPVEATLFGSHCQVQAFEAKVIKAPGWQYSGLMPKGGHAWNKRRPAQEVKNVIMRTSCVCVCLASLLAGLKFACKHGRGHDRHVLIIQWLLLSAKVQLVVKASLTWRYIRYTYRRLFWKTESWSLVHPCPCLAVNMEAWNTLLVV